MKNIISFLLCSLAALPSMGQRSKWHELEGYYQSPANKEMYVRFTAVDTLLVAKLLWNGGELHLAPDTGLAFISKETEDGGAIHIRFLRDGSGTVNRVDVANNGVWTRAPNYKPISKQEMAHTPEQLQAFTGMYRLKEDSTQYAKITVDNNSLTVNRPWDDDRLDGFVPEKELQFYKKDRPIIGLQFSRDAAGKIVQFVAFGRDVWVRADLGGVEKGQLQFCQGRFRSKDDPDNEVRVIANDTGLVIKQLWDGKEIPVGHVSGSFFYNADRRYPLYILRDEKGAVNQILLLNREVFEKVGN